jgi:predicted permease
MLHEDMRSDGRTLRVYANSIAPSFFATLGIPILAGRDFTTGDDPTAPPVAIVNETLAQRFWPGQTAVGKRLEAPDGFAVEVVGLARDSKYESLQEEPKAFMYRPLDQSVSSTPTFLIKATGDPAPMFSLLRARVAELDPDLAAYNVMSLDDRLGLGLMANRAAAGVSAGMGLMALLLSGMGIYGTMSFLVQQRKREIGVRIALGASRWDVMSLVARQGMTWTGIGLAVGITCGLAAALLLRRVVHGVVVADPLPFVVTPLILAAAAYLACYIPARRATRMDPLAALREE